MSMDDGFDNVIGRYMPMGETRPGDKGGAAKMDAGKVPLYEGCLEYFPDALKYVAWVSDYGFRKYGTWGGWRKVADGFKRYFNAKTRHMLPEGGEVYDEKESQLAHLAMETWNALATLQIAIEEKRIEVRRGNEIQNLKPILNTYKVVQ